MRKMNIDGMLFQELIKEVVNKNIYNFRLVNKQSYGDILEETKKIDVTKDSLIQLMNFDIDIHLDFSFIEPSSDQQVENEEQTLEQKLSKKYEKIDKDCIQSIILINKICDSSTEVNIDNIKSMVEEEDFITKSFLEKAKLNLRNNLLISNNPSKLQAAFLKSTYKKRKVNYGSKNSTLFNFIGSSDKIEDYQERLKSKKNKNRYIIDEYINQRKVKVNILQGDLLEKLNEKIKNFKEKINFYKYSDNNELYIGTQLGEIYKYNFKIQSEIYPNPIVCQFKDMDIANPALCIDTKDTVVIVGFQRGQINIWRKDKLIDSFDKDPNCKAPIICVKIVKIKGKKIEFLSSDTAGNLTLTKRVESLFNPKITHENLYENFLFPIFSMDFIEYKINSQDETETNTGDGNLKGSNTDTGTTTGSSTNDLNDTKLSNMFFLLGTVEDVKIVKIRPKLKEIYTYQKQSNILLDQDCIPDFCYGKGCLPRLKDSFYKKFTDGNPKLVISPNTLFDLLLISWGQEILLFCTYDLIDQNTQNRKKQLCMVCRYIHAKTIIKIGFICQSFIYIIDKDELTVKNTKFLSNEEISSILDEDKFNKISVQKINLSKQSGKSNEELTPPIKTHDEFLLLEDDFEKSFCGTIYSATANLPKKNYVGKIINIEDGIVIFNTKNIKHFYISHWKKILENLSEDNLWSEVFGIGVELIINNNTYFLPIDNMSNIKEKMTDSFRELLYVFLNYIINQYNALINKQRKSSVITNDGGENKNDTNKGPTPEPASGPVNVNNNNTTPGTAKGSDHLNIDPKDIFQNLNLTVNQNSGKEQIPNPVPKNNMDPKVYFQKMENINLHVDFLIEFCIKVNLFDFLFKNMFDIIELKNFSDTFFGRLEKYIFYGCFKNYENVPEKMLMEIINYYLNKGKKIFLSKLLMNFPANALAMSQIRGSIIDNDLINVFIYLYMNSDEYKDYFRPIEVIYTLMMQKKECDDYLKFILTRDMNLLSDDIISSKQYYGHRLFWYADFCLNGVKFPNMELMEREDYSDIVVKIFLFLLSKCPKLISFDSYSFFQVMNRFILEKQLFMEICIDYKHYENFIENLDFDYEVEINHFNPNYFVKILMDKCKEMDNNFFIMRDLYDFLSIICEKKIHNDITLKKEDLLKAIDFYFKYNANKSESFNDPFQNHQDTLFEFDNERDIIETKIIAIINYLSKELTKDEIHSMLEKYEIGSFNNVKVVLLNRLKSYIESFEIQLRKINPARILPGQKESLFTYIASSINELTEKKDMENLNNFKSTILNKLPELSEISLDDVTKLVDDYFKDQQVKVIEKLSISPSLQLKYVQNYLKLHTSKKNNSLNNFAVVPVDTSDYYKNFDYPFINSNNNESNINTNINSNDENISTSMSSGSDTSSSNEMEPKYYDEVLESSKKNEEDLKLYNLYVLEIKLLCELNRKEDVFNIISKNISICNEEVLKILLNHKVYDSAIFVYRAIGGYEDGVELTKNVIAKNYNKMIRNLLNDNFKEKINEMLLDKHRQYLDLGISICQRISESQLAMMEKMGEKGIGEELNDKYFREDPSSIWLKILEALYQIKSNIKQYIKQNSNNYKTYFYRKINDTISFSIEVTLSKMCDYLKLPVVINIVTEQIKGVTIDFKEFKKLLLGMIFSLREMESLLGIVKVILHKNIIHERDQYLIEYNKGNEFYINNGCNLCKKSLKIDDEYYYVFKCGHCYHDCCCYKDRADIRFCILCKRQEIEKSVTTLGEYIMIIKENEGEVKPGFEGGREKKKRRKKDYDDRFISLHQKKITSENAGKIRNMMKRTERFIRNSGVLNEDLV